jgi:hypothetical protein
LHAVHAVPKSAPRRPPNYQMRSMTCMLCLSIAALASWAPPSQQRSCKSCRAALGHAAAMNGLL